MPAIATALTERNDSQDAREWVTAAHTLAKPAIIKQRRTPPATAASRATDNLKMIFGVNTTGAVIAGIPLMFDVTVTREADTAAAELTTPLTVFRDIVNSDAFAAMVTGQSYVK